MHAYIRILGDFRDNRIVLSGKIIDTENRLL